MNELYTISRAFRVYLLVAGLVAVAALLLAAWTFNDSRHEQERLRQAALHSCRQVGEPIRLAVEELISDQIRQTSRLSPELFPDIDPEFFREFVSLQQRQRRATLRRLRELPSCGERYADR